MSHVDRDMIRDHYARMTDSELKYTAIQNAHSLTPEAQAILTAELRSRNMDAAIARAVERQNTKMTLAELDAYCELLRTLPCPHCGDSTQKLNGALVCKVMSFLVITQYQRQVQIGCPACLDKMVRSATITTALTGWWGIPWGMIRTIEAISKNISSKKYHYHETPNDYLRSFTMKHIALIDESRDNPQALYRLIAGR